MANLVGGNNGESFCSACDERIDLVHSYDAIQTQCPKCGAEIAELQQSSYDYITK